MSAVNPRRLGTLGHRDQIELALRRLGRFAALEREYAGQLNEAGVRLVRASTFSAYCDCRALGVGKRADRILTEAGVPLRSVAARETVAAR